MSGQLLDPTELWLHNPSSQPVGYLRLTVGELRAPDGRLFGPGVIGFDPAEIAVLPARSARGAVVSLSAEDHLEPGIYRGMVLADGAPDLWVSLELAVERGLT